MLIKTLCIIFKMWHIFLTENQWTKQGPTIYLRKYIKGYTYIRDISFQDICF